MSGTEKKASFVRSSSSSSSSLIYKAKQFNEKTLLSLGNENNPFFVMQINSLA
jgi:hypothetical protein